MTARASAHVLGIVRRELRAIGNAQNGVSVARMMLAAGASEYEVKLAMAELRPVRARNGWRLQTKEEREGLHVGEFYIGEAPAASKKASPQLVRRVRGLLAHPAFRGDVVNAATIALHTAADEAEVRLALKDLGAVRTSAGWRLAPDATTPAAGGLRQKVRAIAREMDHAPDVARTVDSHQVRRWSQRLDTALDEDS